MKKTYRAMQVTKPGTLELVQCSTPEPGPGEVLIQVEACGICGADADDIYSTDSTLPLPRVPGHEVVGRIVAVGANTPSIWKVGLRVGVGRLAGHCNECVQCKRGQFQLCRNQLSVGKRRDGGYAEMMLARNTGLVLIPDELSSEEAAPILCAGIATFNALKKSGAQPGDLVAVVGIGGLGHMALQYAHKMGFKVVAVGRGTDIARDALALGAHVYIDTNKEDVVSKLQSMGGAQAVLTTIGDAIMVSALMASLAPLGRLVVLASTNAPLLVSADHLVDGERSVQGSLVGSPYENERTLNFSALTGARPLIETMPLEKAYEAFKRMQSGEVKFRMVLTMNS